MLLHPPLCTHDDIDGPTAEGLVRVRVRVRVRVGVRVRLRIRVRLRVS